MISLILGDCLEKMREIEGGSVDMILCDLPYGTTACSWDVVIPFAPLWEHYRRLIKENGAVLLFGTEPFSSALRLSNLPAYRYDWYWNKRHAANFLFMNNQPGRLIETISVFYYKQPQYNPKKRINPNGIEKAGRKGIGNTIREHLPNCPDRSRGGKFREEGKLLPNNILEFSKHQNPIHPTQKPIDLLTYLIETFSNEGETVLDNTMGSGSTGVACVKTGRSFIGIEKDPGYFAIAEKRIREAQQQMMLPLEA